RPAFLRRGRRRDRGPTRPRLPLDGPALGPRTRAAGPGRPVPGRDCRDGPGGGCSRTAAVLTGPAPGPAAPRGLVRAPRARGAGRCDVRGRVGVEPDRAAALRALDQPGPPRRAPD